MAGRRQGCRLSRILWAEMTMGWECWRRAMLSLILCILLWQRRVAMRRRRSRLLLSYVVVLYVLKLLGLLVILWRGLLRLLVRQRWRSVVSRATGLG